MADPSSTASGQQHKFLSRAYGLTGNDDAKDLYNEWAESYDKDLNAEEYASPQRAVEAVIKHLGQKERNIDVLDAGCGTGLVGEYFKKTALFDHLTIDGLDLSDGMLAVARSKGIYHHLEAADLSQRLAPEDASYDVVICVGTLTKGHVGPQVFGEFARVTAKGGLIVTTVHGEIWESGGYKAAIEHLRAQKAVEVLSTDEFGILKETRKGGIMVVLERASSKAIS